MWCLLGMGLSADDLAVDLAPINITARVEDQLVCLYTGISGRKFNTLQENTNCHFLTSVTLVHFT